MILLRIALPIFLSYILTTLSLGMFIVFLATEFDHSKLLEITLFSIMGLLDLIGLIYLFVMRKRVMGVYKISEDGISLDVEKGERTRLLEKKGKGGLKGGMDVEEMVGRRDRVMDLY